jgi:hypothetical protein
MESGSRLETGRKFPLNFNKTVLYNILKCKISFHAEHAKNLTDGMLHLKKKSRKTALPFNRE